MAFDTQPMELLTADEVWGAKDIETVDVAVPQWGRDKFGKPKGVRIRTFTKKQADQMRKDATKKRFGKDEVDMEMMEALLFTEGVIVPKFELADYERLQDKSAVALSIILKAIMDASGLSDLAVSDATKSVARQPDNTNGVLPSERVRDDSGGTPAPNVGG